jgi:hypothetical protein
VKLTEVMRSRAGVTAGDQLAIDEHRVGTAPHEVRVAALLAGDPRGAERPLQKCACPVGVGDGETGEADARRRRPLHDDRLRIFDRKNTQHSGLRSRGE